MNSVGIVSVFLAVLSYAPLLRRTQGWSDFIQTCLFHIVGDFNILFKKFSHLFSFKVCCLRIVYYMLLFLFLLLPVFLLNSCFSEVIFLLNCDCVSKVLFLHVSVSDSAEL